jgi:hypothetical protein
MQTLQKVQYMFLIIRHVHCTGLSNRSHLTEVGIATCTKQRVKIILV